MLEEQAGAKGAGPTGLLSLNNAQSSVPTPRLRRESGGGRWASLRSGHPLTFQLHTCSPPAPPGPAVPGRAASFSRAEDRCRVPSPHSPIGSAGPPAPPAPCRPPGAENAGRAPLTAGRPSPIAGAARPPPPPAHLSRGKAAARRGPPRRSSSGPTPASGSLQLPEERAGARRGRAPVLGVYHPRLPPARLGSARLRTSSLLRRRAPTDPHRAPRPAPFPSSVWPRPLRRATPPIAAPGRPGRSTAPNKGGARPCRACVLRFSPQPCASRGLGRGDPAAVPASVGLRVCESVCSWARGYLRRAHPWL